MDTLNLNSMLGTYFIENIAFVINFEAEFVSLDSIVM
jgi:hypothetical protein